jgi:hypothetical protein
MFCHPRTRANSCCRSYAPEYYDTQASVPSTFRRDPSIEVFERLV